MKIRLIACLCLCLCLLLAPTILKASDALSKLTRPWRDNPIWYDGKAEIAIYDATCGIYRRQRHYQARFITNKETASPKTFTKSPAHLGREVFKFHLREDIPTENYTYHYSTMVYVGTDDLKSLKLDMGSQEDCGASFKQWINHAGKLWWRQHSYFPNEGFRSGEMRPPTNMAFMNVLPLILRGFDFQAPREIHLNVINNQTTTQLSDTTLTGATVSWIGKEALDLPIGSILAHHLRVTVGGGSSNEAGVASAECQDLWFAADPKLLHIMVQMEGPNRQSYRLRSVTRKAYWAESRRQSTPDPAASDNLPDDPRYGDPP